MRTVKGYLVMSEPPAGVKVRLETLYALLDDGTVLVSDTHLYDIEFDSQSRRWARASEVPSNAEYIGNYPIPA